GNAACGWWSWRGRRWRFRVPEGAATAGESGGAGLRDLVYRAGEVGAVEAGERRGGRSHLGDVAVRGGGSELFSGPAGSPAGRSRGGGGRRLVSRRGRRCARGDSGRAHDVAGTAG